jgi:hypothetical protein
MKTLPQLCARAGIPLDSARRMLRADPALAALGRVYGSVKLFDETAEAIIATAFQDRRGARKRPATAK